MLRKKSKVLSGLLTAALVLGTMCVPAFATETSDISLDNIEYDYIIDSVDDLFALEEDVEDQNAGSASAPSAKTINVRLDADIVLDEWDGIGTPQSFIGYSGIFNGNGHTITVAVNNTSNVGPKGGLFNLTVDATILDLTLEGDVNSNRFIGGIVGRAMGDLTITDCDVDMDLTLSNGASNSIGGLIGQCGSGSGGGTGGGGGTSGGSQGTVKVTGCNVAGTFTSNTSSNPVGGMFGHIYSGYAADVSNSTVSATLINEGGARGAYIGNNAGVVTLTSCTNNTGVSDNVGVNNNGSITVQ